MIFGFVNQLRRKERGFNYKPISYDADLKDFRDKVQERTSNPEKKFDFRSHRKATNQRHFQLSWTRAKHVGEQYMGNIDNEASLLEAFFVNGCCSKKYQHLEFVLSE